MCAIITPSPYERPIPVRISSCLLLRLLFYLLRRPVSMGNQPSDHYVALFENRERTCPRRPRLVDFRTCVQPWSVDHLAI